MKHTSRTAHLIAAGVAVVVGSLAGSAGTALAGDANLDGDVASDDLIVQPVDDAAPEDIAEAAETTKYPQVPLGWRQVSLEWDDEVSAVDALVIINELGRR